MSAGDRRAENARTIVPDSGLGRLAITSLTYSLLVFVAPVATRSEWPVWALTTASLIMFVLLYLDFCRHAIQPHALFRPETIRSPRATLDLVLMALLGFALVPFNVAGTTYVIYAAALAPFVFTPLRCLLFLFGLALAVAAEVSLSALPDRVVIVAWVVVLIFITGVGNLFVGDRTRKMAQLRLAQEDAEELAKVAERERIARDLHDVLGHTLSVIALKSELAAKLADSDPPRAAQEIREVEQVSRGALAEVRRAVEGYRGRGLLGELEKVGQALSAGDVRVETEIAQIPLSPRHETVLSLALREAVTNVIRHARASVCRIELRQVGSEIVLTVRDDGKGGELREGFGLSGMRERVIGAGGALSVEGTNGTSVTVRLPISAPSPQPVSS